MILTREELDRIVFGKLFTEETDDGFIAFRRFTKGQAELLRERGFSPRENGTAGMFLEIEGGIKSISFDARVLPGSSRTYPNIDFCENGVLTSSVEGPTNEDGGRITYEMKAPGRLTVWFPNLMELQVKNVSVEGNYVPGNRSKKVYVSGDSITQGYDAAHPSKAYVNLVAERFGLEIVNQAIGGDFFIPENLDPDLPFCFDKAVIAYGTNDWKHRGGLRDTSFEYLRRLRAYSGCEEVYVLLPIWREEEALGARYFGCTLGEAREIVRESAVLTGCVPVDASGFVPKDTSCFSDQPALHPNDQGFAHYAANLIAYLEQQGF